MSFVLFHFTIVVLLASVLTSATCLSAYLVSHKRLMLFAFLGFLFYFFDVAWVFQDAFAFAGGDVALGNSYLLVRSLASVVAGGGFLVSFWLLIGDYLGETRRVLLIAPGVVFAAGSIGMLVLLPESDLQRFLFYSMRGALLLWMLLYLAYRYVAAKDEVEKNRLKKHRTIYVLLWVLGAAMVAEDAYSFLFSGAAQETNILSYFAERNYVENVLMLCCMFYAFRAAFRSLALRFDRPPKQSDKLKETIAGGSLMMYGKRHQLSEREQEVLELVLLGKDNQNIASSMHLAPGTVKVHVHNILQKTAQPNRQTLIQDFWKTS
ncbi:MAG: helix-turn-helix transcriptional regulator [Gordonibacter sp.]